MNTFDQGSTGEDMAGSTPSVLMQAIGVVLSASRKGGGPPSPLARVVSCEIQPH
jgi:hypothetical protein